MVRFANGLGTHPAFSLANMCGCFILLAELELSPFENLDLILSTELLEESVSYWSLLFFFKKGRGI